jgi:hypothetical protein
LDPNLDWHLGIFAMQIKTYGRSVSIVAAAAFALFAASLLPAPAFACDPGQPCAPEASAAPESASSTAATTDAEAAGAPLALKKFTKKRRHTASRHHRGRNVASRTRSAHGKTVAAKSDDDKTDDTAKKTAQTDNTAPKSDQVTPEVANAQARFASPEMQDRAATSSETADAAAAAPEGAGNDNNSQIVPADQLNEIDQAADATPSAQPTLNPAQPTLNLASLDSRPSSSTSHAEASADDSTWAETSMIGKIFIALGAMLTLASAARMFFA